MLNAKRDPVKKLLSYAVKAEIDANRIYQKLSVRVKNPFLKEKFVFLALEEKKHLIVLESLFAVLYPDKKIQVPESVDEALLPLVKITPSASLAAILYQAMTAEKSAQDFYAALAKRVKAEKKRVLTYLSKVEKSHFLMLKCEYVLAQQYEDYAERDIDKVVT